MFTFFLFFPPSFPLPSSPPLFCSDKETVKQGFSPSTIKEKAHNIYLSTVSFGTTPTAVAELDKGARFATKLRNNKTT